MKSACCPWLCNPVLILSLLFLAASPSVGAAQATDDTAKLSLAALPRWFTVPESSDLFASLPSSPSLAWPKIEPALLRQLVQKESSHVRFIVRLTEQADLPDVASQGSVLARRRHVVAALQATAERTQVGIRAWLAQEQAAGRVAGVRSFWIFNGLALTGSREVAFALAARPDVEFLLLDHQRHLPGDSGSALFVTTTRKPSSSVEWHIERIRAPLAWNALDIDGTGVVVANVDSGVDWLHPALQSRYRGYDPHGVAHQHSGNWFDATGEGAVYPVDGNGHGTHTMGTIVGSDGVGVAPGARWVAARAFNSFGVGYDSWIHAAFEWMLAPAGDPARAPDIVNNSWSNNISSSEVFRDDVEVLQQAGILAVFAAGNNGPGDGTVGSPASYPEALAVGATDADDEITYFSGRGPSPWGQVKPEVSAPGVSVRSTLPGGSFGVKQGTSMATPHVVGVLALMLQADENLAVADAGRVITSTAVPLPMGGSVPNNSYGWGRVDAYAAVMAVAARGVLSGTVTRAAGGGAIPWAAVSATPTEGGSTVQTTADYQGCYAMGLLPGLWDVTVSAFGYDLLTLDRIELVSDTTTIQDFVLTARPTGLLSGTVVEADSGVALSATLLVEGTPAWAAASPATGAFSLSLPAGVYTVSARSEGHRVGWARAVPVTAGQTTIRHFDLITAPTILLVDSGAWYYGSQIDYYRSALDGLDFLYETHTIKHLPEDVSTLSTLLPQDIVIWSAPGDAPGYIGASEIITPYLESGGRLLLSGQDVGFWDGGGSGLIFARYFWDYLYSTFVSDNAATRQVKGRGSSRFDGLSFSIEGGDGADNQAFPDVIRVYDPDFATSVFHYQDDGSAGQQVGLCLPYRALYLAFGFEGIDSIGARREVMQRAIDWLMSPRQERGVEWAPQTKPTQIGAVGEVVTHVLRLRNTGETVPVDTYDVTLESLNGWARTLSANTVSLSSCLATNLTVTVEIPLSAGWDEVEILTLTARSRSDPGIASSVVITSKTPAPLLLVDDDRWYDQEDRYMAALAAQGYRHDVWDVQARGQIGPPTGTLSMYPIVLWYTAYDWYLPLTAHEEARLMNYLDAGGRLFFSSQDYLYVSGLTGLGRDYFGLADYTEDLTSTAAAGVRGNPVGGRLGPFPLEYPFRNWSDAVEPASAEDAVFTGQHGAPIGLSHADGNHKTVFFSFPFEALDEEARSVVVERVVGWLNWLGESTFEADKALAAHGDTLTYTLTLHNDGLDDVALAAVTNVLPVSLTLVMGSLTPGEVSYEGGVVRWWGALAQGQGVTIQYQAQLTTPMPTATWFPNPVQIYLADHDLAFTRTAYIRVNAPDLDASLFAADRESARPGETLTYTLVLRNDGPVDAPGAWLTNPLPEKTTYVSDSLVLQGGGAAHQVDGVISWSGLLLRDQPVTLAYRAVITDYAGYDIVGRAWLADGYGEVWEKKALVTVPYFKVYLPLIPGTSPR